MNAILLACIIYLAGPDVFLENSYEVGREKKATISKLNRTEGWDFRLIGSWPLDNQIIDPGNNFQTGIRIYEANKKLMDRADFIVANMVQFRGPSMDVGTAFEMGYMAGLEKPIFGYYSWEQQITQYVERVVNEYDPDSGVYFDENHMVVENFEMTDNLMMIGSINEYGYGVAENFEDAIRNIADYVINEGTEVCTN